MANWQALGSVGSSLISGLFGQIGQRQQLNQSLQQQQLAFQQNKELAALQNEYNIAQWQRENEYNLPKNQMSRLKGAGLNPDLMYGNGISGLTSATSPSMSAGSPMTPIDMTMGGRRKTIGDIMNESIQNGLATAQIGLMKAQARKANSEATGQDIHNKSIFEMDRAEIEQKLAARDYSKQQIDESIQRIENMKKEFEQISVNMDFIRKQMDNIDFQQAQDKLRLAMEQALNDAEVKRRLADTGLSMAQAYRFVALLPGELLQQDLNAGLTVAQTYEAYGRCILNSLEAAGVELDNVIKSPDAMFATQFMSDNTWKLNKEIAFASYLLGIVSKNVSPMVKFGSK